MGYWRPVRSVEDWAAMMSMYEDHGECCRDQGLADYLMYTTLIRVFNSRCQGKDVLNAQCNAVITSCCKGHGVAHNRLMVMNVSPITCNLT